MSSDYALDNLFARALQIDIYRGLDLEHIDVFALHQAFDFTKGPVKEIVGCILLFAYLDLSWLQAGAMHLPFGHETGLHEIGQNFGCTLFGQAGLLLGAYFDGALNRPAIKAASASVTSRIDLPK